MQRPTTNPSPKARLVCVDRSVGSDFALKYAFETSSPQDVIYIAHSSIYTPLASQIDGGEDTQARQQLKWYYENLCSAAGVRST